VAVGVCERRPAGSSLVVEDPGAQMRFVRVVVAVGSSLPGLRIVLVGEPFRY
jgi:hypothetical protein